MSTVQAPPEILTLADRLRDGVANCTEALKGIGDNDPVTVENVLNHCFDTEDSERLLAWVRAFMRERHESYVAARLRTGPVTDDSSARAIRATRDPVSRDVAVALGFTSNPFEPQHGMIVWWLCEIAGWPDSQEPTP